MARRGGGSWALRALAVAAVGAASACTTEPPGAQAAQVLSRWSTGPAAAPAIAVVAERRSAGPEPEPASDEETGAADCPGVDELRAQLDALREQVRRLQGASTSGEAGGPQAAQGGTGSGEASGGGGGGQQPGGSALERSREQAAKEHGPKSEGPKKKEATKQKESRAKEPKKASKKEESKKERSKKEQASGERASDEALRSKAQDLCAALEKSSSSSGEESSGQGPAERSQKVQEGKRQEKEHRRKEQEKQQAKKKQPQDQQDEAQAGGGGGEERPRTRHGGEGRSASSRAGRRGTQPPRAEAQPRQPQEVDGEVVASSRDKVVVRDDGGDLLMVRVRDSTRIHEHDRRLEAEDLTRGTRVKVHLAPEAHAERQDTAAEIEVEASGG